MKEKINNQPLLEIDKLVKYFPVIGSDRVIQAVNDVSFKVNKGQTIGLVGESGSGKTTVGRCVAKLTPVTGGKIIFRGEEISKMREKDFKDFRRNVQMVFQQPFDSLNPAYTAFETISEPLLLYVVEKENNKITELVLDIMDQVHLDPRYLRSYPFELNSGAQQRLSIARAIATKPDLIILDEATSMLDLSIRAEIIDLLISLQEKLHIAYIFISHDLTTVEYICHYVAVMYLSQIVEYGLVDQVFNNPKHPYSKALLSSALPPNPIIKRSAYLIQGEIPSPVDLPIGCFLASRCPEIKPDCKKNQQILQNIGSDHFVRCWRVINGEI